MSVSVYMYIYICIYVYIYIYTHTHTHRHTHIHTYMIHTYIHKTYHLVMSAIVSKSRCLRDVFWSFRSLDINWSKIKIKKRVTAGNK